MAGPTRLELATSCVTGRSKASTANYYTVRISAFHTASSMVTRPERLLRFTADCEIGVHQNVHQFFGSTPAPPLPPPPPAQVESPTGGIISNSHSFFNFFQPKGRSSIEWRLRCAYRSGRRPCSRGLYGTSFSISFGV